MGKEDKVFLERLERHHDELRWLYMELYDNDSMFAELSDNLRQFYLARNKEYYRRRQSLRVRTR